MKIEIDFEQAYDTNVVLPIYLGRLIIGNHSARLFFTHEGKTKLFISKEAIEDGSIVLGQVFDGLTYMAVVDTTTHQTTASPPSLVQAEATSRTDPETSPTQEP